MATYSAQLETTCAGLIANAKNVLGICNSSRINFETLLAGGTYWRDYSEKVLTIFENINDMERDALFLIEQADAVRKLNDALRT